MIYTYIKKRRFQFMFDVDRRSWTFGFEFFNSVDPASYTGICGVQSGTWDYYSGSTLRIGPIAVCFRVFTGAR